MRVGVFVAVTLWLTPVLAVGLTGLGLTHVAAITIGFAAAAVIGWWTSRPLKLTDKRPPALILKNEVAPNCPGLMDRRKSPGGFVGSQH